MSSYIHLTLEEGGGQLKTSLVNYMAPILVDDDVLEFDKLRFNLKANLKAAKRTAKGTYNSTMKSRYNLLSAKLGSKVLSMDIKLEKQLHDTAIKFHSSYSISN